MERDFWNYASEDDALYDVLRLSRGMTLKNAAAGLQLGGGEAVIIGDPKKLKNREFLLAYAEAINSLGGKYYTAEDVNFTTADVAVLHEKTSYVTGTSEKSGDPAPYTAKGVFQGILAGANEAFGSTKLAGKVAVIQGLGSVGFRVAKMLHDAGVMVKVFDVNSSFVDRAVKELGATPIHDVEVVTTPCDMFVPCALGAVLNEKNSATLPAKLVAGCANNIFVDARSAEKFSQRGGVYCPDYIINSGGVINCGAEITDPVFSVDAIWKKVDAIYDTTTKILKFAKEKGISSYAAADRFAMEKIELAKSLSDKESSDV